MIQKASPAPANEWSAVLIGLFLMIGAGILLLLSVLLLFLGLTALPIGRNTSGSLSMLILSAGTFGLGILLLPGIYLNARNLLNLPPSQPGAALRISDRMLMPIMIIAWLTSLMLGQIASRNLWASALVLPITNIFAIGLPVLFYIRISLRGLELPPAKRGWSVFGASLLISPLLALIFEVLAVGVIFILYMVYASSVPGLKDALSSLVSGLQSGSSNDNESMRLAANLAFAPGAIPALLITFSLAIPLIEETLKITVIWFYLGRLRRPLDGFVLGILCGAAFALTENLGFSSAGAADWAASAAARATSALPHIFNSGLLGWALVSVWKEKRYGRLAGTFLAVILIHGAWNVISLGLALSEFSPFVADVPAFLQNSYPWYAAWGLMVIGTLAGLILNNRQMRKLAASEESEKLGYNSRLLSQNTGGNDNGITQNPD